MWQFTHILKKEIKDYFVSPIAYIVISIFLIITGWFFFSPFFLYDQANMRGFFSMLPIIFSFVIPAITMRLFSEELNIGSYEILLTMPVTFKDIILGKFAAGFVMTAAMLLPTIAYPISISFIGGLDWGPVIGGYIGAMLLGGTFSAIGVFASSLTHNQIMSFILGAAICFTLTLRGAGRGENWNEVSNIIEYIGADFHFRNIAKGIIDSRDILYFLSVMFISLYATYLALLKKE